MGLDREKGVSYSNHMKLSLLFKHAHDEDIDEVDQEEQRKDLSLFVQEQFRELVKRNLGVPVTVCPL